MQATPGIDGRPRFARLARLGGAGWLVAMLVLALVLTTSLRLLLLPSCDLIVDASTLEPMACPRRPCAAMAAIVCRLSHSPCPRPARRALSQRCEACRASLQEPTAQ